MQTYVKEGVNSLLIIKTSVTIKKKDGVFLGDITTGDILRLVKSFQVPCQVGNETALEKLTKNS